jgi:DNA-directed RNA polymerase alpha subunit
MLDKDIKSLELEQSLIDKLRLNNINKIGELHKLRRPMLKNMGVTDSEINRIIIKLQLLGLDLNSKLYK